ncbi:SDR family oxidoreductase [Arthrobacter sp. TB 23]|uniref:SDR family oxidoreductase n=1 Tax=Arthrobacter sp. TB 23 TaxID=494419 RepID=UPI001ED90696|nr:SDR family oxidoreductase [Arthrobacter sp. TB 23]
MSGILDRFSLDGRRILVTGGSRGLGQAMARGLAQAGAQVVAVARTPGHDEIDSGIRNLAGDVANTAAIPTLVDEAEKMLGGTVDSVVHAAGVQHRAAAVDFPLDEWERVVRINLTAPFMLSQEVGRRQLTAGVEGSHVFVASLTSTLGLPNIAAYAATKSGVMGIVRSLAVEWAAQGIRVNAIGPGYFRTALTENLFQNDEAREGLLKRIPQKRFGNPDDLSGALVYLASNASAYVTGQLLMVDGGWTAA